MQLKMRLWELDYDTRDYDLDVLNCFVLFFFCADVIHLPELVPGQKLHHCGPVAVAQHVVGCPAPVHKPVHSPQQRDIGHRAVYAMTFSADDIMTHEVLPMAVSTRMRSTRAALGTLAAATLTAVAVTTTWGKFTRAVKNCPLTVA